MKNIVLILSFSLSFLQAGCVLVKRMGDNEYDKYRAQNFYIEMATRHFGNCLEESGKKNLVAEFESKFNFDQNNSKLDYFKVKSISIEAKLLESCHERAMERVNRKLKEYNDLNWYKDKGNDSFISKGSFLPEESWEVTNINTGQKWKFPEW